MNAGYNILCTILYGANNMHMFCLSDCHFILIYLYIFIS